MPAVAAAAIAGGAAIFGSAKQAGAQRRASETQARANTEALTYQREQDAEQKRQFDLQQSEAKAQWEAQQAMMERQFGASEEERLYGRAEQDAKNRRRNAGLLKLGDLLGTDLSSSQYPTGDMGGGGGGMSAPVDPATESYFSSLTAGKAPTPDSLIGLEGELGTKGIKVLRNAEGTAGKIQLPNGQIVDVIEAAGAGGKRWQWLTGGGGAPARRPMPSSMAAPGMAPQMLQSAAQTPYAPVLPFKSLMGSR